MISICIQHLIYNLSVVTGFLKMYIYICIVCSRWRTTVVIVVIEPGRLTIDHCDWDLQPAIHTTLLTVLLLIVLYVPGGVLQ